MCGDELGHRPGRGFLGGGLRFSLNSGSALASRVVVLGFEALLRRPRPARFGAMASSTGTAPNDLVRRDSQRSRLQRTGALAFRSLRREDLVVVGVGCAIRHSDHLDHQPYRQVLTAGALTVLSLSGVKMY